MADLIGKLGTPILLGNKLGVGEPLQRPGHVVRGAVGQSLQVGQIDAAAHDRQDGQRLLGAVVECIDPG
jgi:hypothetical protein